jgi:hypothetical protein
MMHALHARLARIIVAGLLAALLMAPLAAAAWGLGAPGALSVAAATVAVAAIWVLLAASLPESLEQRARSRWWLTTLWLLIMGALVVRVGVLSIFMVDPTRVGCSMLPGLPDLVRHSCLSAYTEANRLAAEGRHNIYAPELYDDRSIGTFSIDRYEYPPQFLLFPKVIGTVTADFHRARALVFGLQVVLLTAAIIVLAVWIGGQLGLSTALLAPLLWLSFQLLMPLQVGNFQMSLVSLCVLSMVMVWRGSPVGGGAGLAFATVTKIYPGILPLYAVLYRRWAAALWSVAFVAAYTLAAYLIYGSQPYLDFFSFQLPRLSTGDAFPWLDRPDHAPINFSIYGLVTKLRELGMTFLERGVGNAVSWVYSLAVVGLALLAWRRFPRDAADDPVDRMGHACGWLALLNLAAMRSPFLPSAFALLSTTWLITLLAASRVRWRRYLWLAALLPLGVPTMPGTSAAVILASMAQQLLALGINMYCLVSRRRGIPLPPTSLHPEALLVGMAR